MKKQIEDLTVLGYTWHEPHQYELSKLGFKYILQYHYKNVSSHGNWNIHKRALPQNVLALCNITNIDYDLNISHLDEECVPTKEPFMSNNWDGMFKSQRKYCTEHSIPQIIINHGVPKNLQNIEEMQEIVDDTYCVCNSEQSAKMWNFPNSKSIIHGIDPEEFKLGSADNGKVLCSVNYGVLKAKKWYYGYDIYQKVSNNVRIKRLDEPFKSFNDYVNGVGKYSVYFNPTLQSPMPRARTESMMMGVPTVSTPYYDWGKYVKDGKNGMLYTTADEAIEKIKWLLENPKDAKEIGMKGRETAIKHFHIDRYLDDWRKLIHEVIYK